MLSFSNVSAGYGGVPVLKDIGFQVADGEMVAIFGHNGAGKTTLMRCAVGDMAEVSGEITWRGEAIIPKAVFRNVRLGIGFVPQGHNVFRELTVRRNLTIAGLHHPDVDVEDIYRLFPILKQRGAQMASSLSGGQQQILALGMALMTKPRILLLDEPSTGLAPVIVRDVMDSLARDQPGNQHDGGDRRAEHSGHAEDRLARDRAEVGASGVRRRQPRTGTKRRFVGLVLTDIDMRIWHQSFTVLGDLPGYEDAMRAHLAKTLRPDTEVVFHGQAPGTYPERLSGRRHRLRLHLLDPRQSMGRGGTRGGSPGFRRVRDVHAAEPDVARGALDRRHSGDRHGGNLLPSRHDVRPAFRDHAVHRPHDPAVSGAGRGTTAWRIVAPASSPPVCAFRTCCRATPIPGRSSKNSRRRRGASSRKPAPTSSFPARCR